MQIVGDPRGVVAGGRDKPGPMLFVSNLHRPTSIVSRDRRRWPRDRSSDDSDSDWR